MRQVPILAAAMGLLFAASAMAQSGFKTKAELDKVGSYTPAGPVAPGTTPVAPAARPVAPATTTVAPIQPGTPAATPAATLATVAPAPNSASARHTVNDQLFAAAAADSGLAELALSQLGKQRATDPQLKQFSEEMMQEHTRMNNELFSLAAQKQIALPRASGYCAQFSAQALAALPATEFDHCYAKAQLVAHMEAVAFFEAEAKHGTDRDVTALARKALPELKQHLEKIKPIAKKYMEER